MDLLLDPTYELRGGFERDILVEFCEASQQVMDAGGSRGRDAEE